MIKIRWTGVAGIELTIDDRVLLIDPYLSRIGKPEIFFGRPLPKTDAIRRYLNDLPGRLSAVIAGHTHFDHAMDIPEVARLSDCNILGSRSLDALLTLHGQPNRVTVCSGRENIRLSEDIRITMIPSAHGRVVMRRVPYRGEIDPNLKPPLKASQYRLGAVFAPKVEVNNLTVLHVGSADFIESELSGHRCDILLMCVPGWKKNPAYAARLPQLVTPKFIIPFHFDDFSVPLPDSGNPRSLPFLGMDGFLKAISKCAPDAKIILPTVFQEMMF